MGGGIRSLSATSPECPRSHLSATLRPGLLETVYLFTPRPEGCGRSVGVSEWRNVSSDGIYAGKSQIDIDERLRRVYTSTMQERPTTKGASIRLIEQDEQHIRRIMAAGLARNRSSAVSYALRIAGEQIIERERTEASA